MDKLRNNKMSLLKKKLRKSFKEFPIKLYDSNKNEVYHENSNGYWIKIEYDKNNNEIYFENSECDWGKKEYDSNNNVIYYEHSKGYWEKKEYDNNNNNNTIYYENSNGDWSKREYDSNNNEIYFENSDDGVIIDKRPKTEFTIKEIEEKLGIKNIKIVKEK